VSNSFLNPPFRDPNRKRIEERSRSYDARVLHEDDDVDSGHQAHHHTLGLKGSQAAPGTALAAALERIEALETRLNSPPVDINGVVSPGGNNSMVDAGAVVAAPFTLGTNFAVKQGYMCTIYFNVSHSSSYGPTTSGDVTNTQICTLPGDLQPILNDSIGHSVNANHQAVPHLVLNEGGGGQILLCCLNPNSTWTGGAISFGCSYQTRTWGWN